jgi:hypothetical protein
MQVHGKGMHYTKPEQRIKLMLKTGSQFDSSMWPTAIQTNKTNKHNFQFLPADLLRKTACLQRVACGQLIFSIETQ